ncbi:MAG: hypothetical protein BWY82_02030 [Verrucomicrobia bacterium ADurb.Bin474]|nr:MAG: hypothetical protein BWY82_02030 [Verrucomicrobia bacterium ADurb.Bin474]
MIRRRWNRRYLRHIGVEEDESNSINCNGDVAIAQRYHLSGTLRYERIGGRFKRNRPFCGQLKEAMALGKQDGSPCRLDVADEYALSRRGILPCARFRWLTRADR